MKAKALLLLAPTILMVLFALLYRQEKSRGSAGGAPRHSASDAGRKEKKRLLVVIVDSLRKDTLEKPGVMPHLLAMAGERATRRFSLLTCSANFTLPCLQTLMEGRESPFVSGLHNFTGMEGGAWSLPKSLKDAGLRAAIVGDHTLLDLYGTNAAATWAIESVTGDPLHRDLAAIGKAVELLDAKPSFDALLLHVPGTDKAAHHKRPGTPAYDEHFRLVDEALLRLWQKVDPARDDLMVMGDHGHNDRGDHTRRSLVLMRGPSFDQLLDGMEKLPGYIAQEELVFFMTYPFALPLGQNYEGRFFPFRAQNERDGSYRLSDSLRRFEEVQRRALVGPGGKSRTLVEWAQARDTKRQEEPKRLLFRLLPLLALTLLWALIHFEERPEPERPTPAFTLLFFLSAAGLYMIATPENGAILAAAVLAASLLFSLRQKELRNFIFLLLILTFAGLFGYFARDWAQLMHTRRGCNVGAVLFHLLLPPAGAGLALLRFGRASRFPEGTGLIGLLLLPSGVYYYQAGRNLLLGYAFGEALLLFAKAIPGGKRWEKILLRADIKPLGRRSTPRLVAAVAIFVLAFAILLGQEAGGWEWDLWFMQWLRGCPAPVRPLLFWSMGGYIAWQAPTPLGRGLLLSALGLIYAYTVDLARLDPAALVSSLIAVLLLVAVLELDPAVPAARTKKANAGGKATGADSNGASARDALLLAATTLWMPWVLLRGFFISHVKYQFAFDLFGEFAKESRLALVFGLATLLKYGLPLFFALLVYCCRKGRTAAMPALAGLLVLLQLKLLALLLQALLIPLRTTEKLQELALADLTIVLAITLFVALTCLVLWLWGKLEAAAAITRAGDHKLRPVHEGEIRPLAPASSATARQGDH